MHCSAKWEGGGHCAHHSLNAVQFEDTDSFKCAQFTTHYIAIQFSERPGLSGYCALCNVQCIEMQCCIFDTAEGV